jgi:hypothetical protein
VTVEVFRCALMNNGYSVSPRDSFVRGIPLEVDMLIVRPDAAPQHNCLYQPRDVLAAVEVKNYGSFGDSTIATTKANLDRIRGGHWYTVLLCVPCRTKGVQMGNNI